VEQPQFQLLVQVVEFAQLVQVQVQVLQALEQQLQQMMK
jgi:hypothetical protein